MNALPFVHRPRTVAATSVALWLVQLGAWVTATSLSFGHRRGAVLWLVLGFPPVILALVAGRGFTRQGPAWARIVFFALAGFGAFLTLTFALQQYATIGPDSIVVR